MNFNTKNNANASYRSRYLQAQNQKNAENKPLIAAKNSENIFECGE